MNIPGWIMAAVGLLSLINSLLVGWAIWSFKRIAEEKAKEAIKPLSTDVIGPMAKEIGDIEQRLTRIEGSIEHLPTADEVQQLLVKMTEMNGRMVMQTELFVRLERKVDLIDGYLRTGGPK